MREFFVIYYAHEFENDEILCVVTDKTQAERMVEQLNAVYPRTPYHNIHEYSDEDIKATMDLIAKREKEQQKRRGRRGNNFSK